MTVAVFLGDSTTNTATPHGAVTAARLGWTASIQAFGGIGYIKSVLSGDGRFGGGAGPYGPFIDPQIQALVAAANPDVIVCEGGINDAVYAPADIGTAAGVLFDYLRANHPSAQLYVVSPWSVRTPFLVATQAIGVAIKAAAEARGLPYIDMLTKPWLTGSGYIGVEAGDGNNDVYTSADGTHPSPAGSSYIGMRLAFAISPPATGLEY
jgi:lysophospholipase L1-like esterase